MGAGAIAAIALVAALAASRRRGTAVQEQKIDTRKAEMVTLIREEARAAGVPEAVALAFAEVESNFAPYAEGDKHWHELDGGAKYKRLVRDNPKFIGNPARMQPELWHAYGLFQLLAPYHTRPMENPRVLLDPVTNAQRAMVAIKRLLAEYRDPLDARTAYVCGSLRCSAAKRAEIARRFVPAYERWAAGAA